MFRSMYKSTPRPPAKSLEVLDQVPVLRVFETLHGSSLPVRSSDSGVTYAGDTTDGPPYSEEEVVFPVVQSIVPGQSYRGRGLDLSA